MEEVKLSLNVISEELSKVQTSLMHLIGDIQTTESQTNKARVTFQFLSSKNQYD